MSEIKKIIYCCDVCQSNIDGNPVESFRFKNMTVIFLTEQNEGRNTDPYFSQVDIDICQKCQQFMMKGYMLFARGAMGYNQYNFGSK